LTTNLIVVSITSIKKIDMNIYFENLTDELHIIYAFNTYVKCCAIKCYLLYDP